MKQLSVQQLGELDGGMTATAVVDWACTIGVGFGVVTGIGAVFCLGWGIGRLL